MEVLMGHGRGITRATPPTTERNTPMSNTTTASQCRYCVTDRGHDYAHPHVVRAVNEQAIAAFERTYGRQV
jgi:hypothetical protein